MRHEKGQTCTHVSPSGDLHSRKDEKPKACVMSEMTHMLMLSVCDDTRGAQLSSPAVSYIQGNSKPMNEAICALKLANFSASNASRTLCGIMH